MSMISSESRMISGLRRSITPSAPIAKRSAGEDRRTSGCQARASLLRSRRAARASPRTTPPTAATSSTIEVTSKASRWSVRNSRPIASGEPNERVMCCGFERKPPRLEADDDDHLGEDRAAREHGADDLPRRPARPRRLVGAVAEVGDHEQEHHHHRAGVDEHLGRGDELAREQQEEHGERGEVPDQRERRVERVREADDRERARQAGERGTTRRPDEKLPRHPRASGRTLLAIRDRGHELSL